ncbi:MAG: hypothetical protein KF817_02405 [Phycisphaeraceae bacterium]|nr:hypothetical protein [Phycisphaeraceae bacterium]
MGMLREAIFHLSGPGDPLVAQRVAELPGVGAVHADGRDPVLSVRFDQAMTGVGDLVRELEDLGARVGSMAIRPVPSIILAPRSRG